jgi:hypothetical protein
MRPLLLLLLLLLRRTPYKQGTDFMERDSIKPIVFPKKERQNNTMILLDSNSKKTDLQQPTSCCQNIKPTNQQKVNRSSRNKNWDLCASINGAIIYRMYRTQV